MRCKLGELFDALPMQLGCLLLLRVQCIREMPEKPTLVRSLLARAAVRVRCNAKPAALLTDQHICSWRQRCRRLLIITCLVLGASCHFGNQDFPSMQLLHGSHY
jgi:hypothetical protein